MVKGKLKVWLWDTFKPPSGVQARRVVMAFTLLVMVGRFGLLRLTSPGSAVRINVIQSWQYGVAYLALFLALYWTRSEKRLTLAGFVTSVFGFALYVVQAFDVWAAGMCTFRRQAVDGPRAKKGLVYGNNRSCA